jgi:hypothetical protein
MLQIGNGMSYEEDKTHFSMWCMLSAPLLIGCDVGSISDEAMSVISNKEIIALDQDEACLSAKMVYEDTEKGYEIWVKDLGGANESYKAVAVLNRSANDITVDLDFSSIGLNGVEAARDLWAHQDKPVTNGVLSLSIPSHGTSVLKVKANADFNDNFTLISNISKAENTVDITSQGETDWLVFDSGESKTGKGFIETSGAVNEASSQYIFNWSDGEKTVSGSTCNGVSAGSDFTVSLPVKHSESVAKLYFSGSGDVTINCDNGNMRNIAKKACESGTLYVYKLEYRSSKVLTLTFSASSALTVYAAAISPQPDIKCSFVANDAPVSCDLTALGDLGWQYFGKTGDASNSLLELDRLVSYCSGE